MCYSEVALSFTPVIVVHFFFFFFNDTATTEIYTLSLHDALPISRPRRTCPCRGSPAGRGHGHRTRGRGSPGRDSVRSSGPWQGSPRSRGFGTSRRSLALAPSLPATPESIGRA